MPLRYHPTLPVRSSDSDAAQLRWVLQFMGMAAVYAVLLTLQVLLLIWLFALPLVTSSTAYHPTIQPTFRQDSVSSYNVTDAGTTEFSAFSYMDTFPLLNTTRTSSPTLLHANTSMTTSSSFAFDCGYTVYANVTQLSVQWIGNAYQWSPTAGDQLTLTAPHCSALNTFRVALILFAAVAGASCILMLLFPIVSLLLRRSPQSFGQAGNNPRGISLSVQARAVWQQRLLTLLLLAVAALVVTGLVMVITLFAWIGRVDLPGAEAGGYAIAAMVMYAVVAVGSMAAAVWEYLVSRKDLKEMHAEDGSVDTSPFPLRLAALLLRLPAAEAGRWVRGVKRMSGEEALASMRRGSHPSGRQLPQRWRPSCWGL